MPRQKKTKEPAVSAAEDAGTDNLVPSTAERSGGSMANIIVEDSRPETEEVSQPDAGKQAKGAGVVDAVTPQKDRTSKASLDKLSPSDRVERKSPGAVPRTKIMINHKTELAYRLIRKCSGVLGGNGYTGAIYGELTMHSMQRVIDFMVAECRFDSSSRFIDIGSGLGKPNFHVAQDPGVRISIGVELEEIRWQLAMHNLQGALKHTSSEIIQCGNSSILGNTNFIVRRKMLILPLSQSDRREILTAHHLRTHSPTYTNST